MYSVLLVIQVMVTLALIVIILVQRSASDGMGLSGSASNSFMSGRSAATFVTRATGVLATLFILLSLALGIVTAHTHTTASSIVDKLETSPANDDPLSPAAPAISKEAPAKETPKPSVPRPE